MSQVPTPKFHYLNNSSKKLAYGVLKEKANNEVKTPQNSRILKENPKKLATTFESLLNDNLKSSATKPKVTNGLNTPIHNSISRLATTPRQNAHYESHVCGSAAIKKPQGSSIKKPYPHINPANIVSKPIVHQSALNSTITFSKPAFDIDPVVNGVDYSEMIAKKAELGYSGPGYIVEFNCDPKYIQGIIIQKGLWRLITDPNYEPDEQCADIGPPMSFQRIDKQESKTTPGKSLTNYDFGWRPRLIRPNEKIFHDTTQNLDLETKSKAKKSLKWASNLEEVKENSFKLSPQVISNVTSSPIPSNEVKRKLRRSFSHNEIVGLSKIETVNYNSHNEDTSLNLPHPSFDIKKDLSLDFHTENKENLIALPETANLPIRSNEIKTDLNVTVEVTTTPDLDQLLKHTQTYFDYLQKNKDAKASSAFQVLKATNMFSLLQDELQKMKDKLLVDSLYKK